MPDRVSRPFASSDLALGLSCGREPGLAQFFAGSADLFEKYGFGRTFVIARDEEDPSGLPDILGFYTLCMARVQLEDLPAELKTAGAPSQVPTALLAQMARQDLAPRGLGRWMVADALRRILRAAEDVGCALVALDAMNASLVEYYRGLGFKPTRRQNQPQKMVMAIATARQALHST